jgi:Protein of unknown function (DUF2950)
MTRITMRTTFKYRNFRVAFVAGALSWACVSTPMVVAGQQPATQTAPAAAPATASSAAPAVPNVQTFNTPQEAANALVTAASQFDSPTIMKMFGPKGQDIVFSGEVALDRQRATDFAAEAHEEMTVSVDPKNGKRAFMLVGKEDWPFPVPIVKVGDKWHFDIAAGRQELLYRRIGSNELDAIAICRGYVDAQQEYALQPRQGYNVNQYAQRIIASPGKQDGLAWKNADGTWGGPVGENIAQAIAQGYSSREDPYHGYFFKILKGQGPDAPLGQMNYIIQDAMIGGFALVASPAEYRVSGVKTFIVSNDGVVYEKDFGPTTLDTFEKMELFNPDKSWTPVEEDDEN